MTDKEIIDAKIQIFQIIVENGEDGCEWTDFADDTNRVFSRLFNDIKTNRI